MHEFDITLPDGRRIHAYDTGTRAGSGPAVVWHHGTPNIGLPPEPLFPTSERLGIRWVSYDRPGYGGSDPRAGRDVASAAGDVAAVVDALEIDRFAVMGHSGGGPHALACAALMPHRTIAALVGASLAPYGSDGLDWFAGMAPSSEAGLRAAAAGRQEKERYEASASDAQPGFIEADWAALSGAWSWFGSVVGPAIQGGPGPLIDDDLAYVAPWGFDPKAITVPTLVLHGEQDRIVPAAHGAWLSARIPAGELWIRPGEGHISILTHAPAGLEWLAKLPGVRT
jgi:pimeloyl-ACP methyl ester carboxylesterase